MNTQKNIHNAVLICDRVSNRDGINIFSDNLEFTSNTYFDAISAALEKCCPKVYYYDNPSDFIDNIRLHQNDIVLSAIWSGTKSRNRKALIASICEAHKIKYLGADTYVQAICQDKELSKLFVKGSKIKVPRGFTFSKGDENYNLLDCLHYPVVVKPNLEGSSIGISDNSICDTVEEAIKKIKEIISTFSPVLVEEYIPGREIAICIAGKNNIDMIEAVEIQIDGNNYFEHQIWGYETKKGGKKSVSRKIITSEIPSDILNEAKKIYLSFGKVDYMRIDGRLYSDDFYLIEFTPDCSLHPDCFMYEAFKGEGYSYDEMIAALINLA